LLLERVRRVPGGHGVDRRWFGRRRGVRLRELDHHAAALGVAAFIRARRAALVFVWLGDATPGDGVAGGVSLPAARSATVCAQRATSRGDVALSLADLPHHD